ncbi:hypothetical protein VNO77_05250 [Canavalia gladiata]|uniref:Uncharacterized protein n=1 Tax=Canavalia gladiata TaxID=3824 RepID=A0AAN9MY14_CANGL
MYMIKIASLKWSKIMSTPPNRGRKKRVISGELHQLWPRPRELLLEACMIRKRWGWQGPCRPYVNACKGLLDASKFEASRGKHAIAISKVVQEVKLEAELGPSDGTIKWEGRSRLHRHH